MKKRLPLILIVISVILLSIALVLIFCGDKDYAFKETKDGRIISVEDGTEYTFLAHEGQQIIYLGDFKHIGRIKGEDKYLRHLGVSLTGMYGPENGDKSNILERVLPHSEWYQIYRNAALPELDLSVDSCVRIELINCLSYHADSSHAYCGFGLTGEQMHDFLRDVRNSMTAREAGLHDSHEYMENCYQDSTVLGYFEDEPNIAVAMDITSYNDKVYTILLKYEDYYQEYIIPDYWMEELRKASHIQESNGGRIQIIPPFD